MNINTSGYDHGLFNPIKRDFKEIDKSKSGRVLRNDTVKKGTDISAKNEAKLSDKAKDFLKNLREQNEDFDFMIGNSTDDLQALSKTGKKEFSVILSSAELERMANDSKYADEKIAGISGAVKMAQKISEENGFADAYNEEGLKNGTVSKIGVVVDDNGNMKLFAELEKNSAKQKERIEKKAEESRTADKSQRKNPYAKDDKPSIKRTSVMADTMEELLEKINAVEWDKIEESRAGEMLDFTV